MPPPRNPYGHEISDVAGPSRGSMSPNVNTGANPPPPIPPLKKKRVARWSKRLQNGFNNSGNQVDNDSNNNGANHNGSNNNNGNGNIDSNSGSGNGNEGSNNGKSGSSNANNGSSKGNGGSNNGNNGSNNANSGSNNGNNGSNNGNSGSNNANSGSANDGSTPTPTGSASSKPPFNPCSQCVVQDNNPSVHYNGTWILNGPQSSTTHSTTVSGSTISLRFNGSGIVVFGTVPASNDTFQPPTAVYFIDQDPPFTTTLPRAAHAIPNQPLFASSQHLSDDEHQLVINITNVSAPYSLAKFFVLPRGSGSKDMIGRPPTGGVISPSMIFPTPTPTDVTSSNPQLASPLSSGAHHKDKAVKTLAGVLGTIAFLLLTGITIFFIFRRRIIAKRQLALAVKPRPETVYTSFTSTESILRNDSPFWSSPLRSPRSQYARSESRSYGSRASDGGRRSTIDFVPPPLPPKPAIFLSFPKPG